MEEVEVRIRERARRQVRRRNLGLGARRTQNALVRFAGEWNDVACDLVVEREREAAEPELELLAERGQVGLVEKVEQLSAPSFETSALKGESVQALGNAELEGMTEEAELLLGTRR